MPAEFVPFEYLQFLITKFIKDENEQRTLRSLAAVARERGRVLAAVCGPRKSLLAEIEEDWIDYGGRALTAWAMHCLHGKTIESLVDDASDSLSRTLPSGVTHLFDLPPKGVDGAFLHSVRWDTEAIHWSVLVVKKTNRRAQINNDPSFTEDAVAIVLERCPGAPRARAYAGSTTAREAIPAMLDALGVDVGSSSRERHYAFSLMHVSEPRLVLLTEREGWARLRTESNDPKGRNGKTVIESRFHNGQYCDLDTSDPEVEALWKAKNNSRAFIANYVHNTGWSEPVRFTLRFGTSSSIQFQDRTSWRAMRYVVDAILDSSLESPSAVEAG